MSEQFSHEERQCVSSESRVAVVLLQRKQSLGGYALKRLIAHCEQNSFRLVVLRTGEAPLSRHMVNVSPLQEYVLDVASWEAKISVIVGRNDARVLTNDEYCVHIARDMAEELRVRCELPPTLDLYTDKWSMRERLAAGGLPVPQSRLVGTEAEFGDWPEEIPSDVGVVVKPRDEANLRGIAVGDYRHIVSGAPDGSIIELFYPGAQYHCEVRVDHGDVDFLFAAEYVRPLLNLAESMPSGSITLDPDGRAWEVLKSLSLHAIDALGTQGRFVAHIEFVSTNDWTNAMVSEVCARAPGGEVPHQSLLTIGADLEWMNLSAQLGVNVDHHSITRAAAWLWIPKRRSIEVAPMLDSTISVMAQEKGLAVLIDSHDVETGGCHMECV